MLVYADNSATTKVAPEVLEAMLPFLEDQCGNASSIHASGRAARDAIEVARAQIAALINADPQEVLFTPCGTASNNVAILGRARFIEANNKPCHLITTAIEHPSALGPAKFLEGKGWSVTYLPVSKEGFVSPEVLRAAITEKTSIISIAWANNEIGTVQPIEKLASLANEREIFFHTDAVQVPGKLPIDLASVPVSSLAASGHKFHAPKGTGFLYLRRGQNVMPLEFGGGQEAGLFPGTEAVANIVALGKAAEMARTNVSQTAERLRRMQSILLERLKNNPRLRVTGPENTDQRLPGHTSIAVTGIEGEALVMRFDLLGICVSSGSACHQGMIEPSHVLRAVGLNDHEANGSLRISLGRLSTDADLGRLLFALDQVLSDEAAPVGYCGNKR
jgi:cysteine desulfurase